MPILTEAVFRLFIDTNYPFIEEKCLAHSDISELLNQLKCHRYDLFIADLQNPLLRVKLFNGSPESRLIEIDQSAYFTPQHMAKRTILFIYFMLLNIRENPLEISLATELQKFRSTQESVFIPQYSLKAASYLKLFNSDVLTQHLSDQGKEEDYKNALADIGCSILFFMRYYCFAVFQLDNNYSTVTKLKIQLAYDIENNVCQLLDILSKSSLQLTTLKQTFSQLGQVIQNAIMEHNKRRGWWHSAGRFGWCLETGLKKYNHYYKKFNLTQKSATVSG